MYFVRDDRGSNVVRAPQMRVVCVSSFSRFISDLAHCDAFTYSCCIILFCLLGIRIDGSPTIIGPIVISLHGIEVRVAQRRRRLQGCVEFQDVRHCTTIGAIARRVAIPAPWPQYIHVQLRVQIAHHNHDHTCTSSCTWVCCIAIDPTGGTYLYIFTNQ